MSDIIKYKELAKNRAYLLTMGDVQISALKLEGYKASQLGGTISPTSIGAQKTNIEGDDWLLVVKDKNDIVMPYSVWVNKLANEISVVTGSPINTISVLTSNEVKVNDYCVGTDTVKITAELKLTDSGKGADSATVEKN
jgi:hypothetical protein